MPSVLSIILGCAVLALTVRWPFITAAVTLVLVIAVLSLEAGIRHLLNGDQRRAAFPSGPLNHPKPDPDWKLSPILNYKTGFVGKSKVWYQCFNPLEPRGIVFAIHGYGDHSDYRIHEFAHDLSTHGGFMTIAIDQPGFGRSDGLYGFIPDWLQHVHVCAGAMIEILNEVRVGSLRELPVLAYGQSMGGGLIICISILYPALFKGIVMTGPMCGINPNLKHHPIIENFFTDIARWFPSLPITPVPDLSMLCFEDLELWERDRRRNQLAFKLKPRLGTAKAMLEAQVWITKNAHKLESPVLILHGDCDRVTSLAGSCRFLEAAGASDKSMETIEGGYHIMLGYGIDKRVSDTVFNKIRDWLTNHT